MNAGVSLPPCVGKMKAERSQKVVAMKEPLPRKRRRWTWLWVGLVVAWFLWTTDPIHLRCARVKAHSAICHNNLKSLASALLTYAEKHDNRLPPAESWMDAIVPYVDNP